jgi:hypothetical protein
MSRLVCQTATSIVLPSLASLVHGRKSMISGCPSYLDSKEDKPDLGQLIYSSTTHSPAADSNQVTL